MQYPKTAKAVVASATARVHKSLQTLDARYKSQVRDCVPIAGKTAGDLLVSMSKTMTFPQAKAAADQIARNTRQEIKSAKLEIQSRFDLCGDELKLADYLVGDSSVPTDHPLSADAETVKAAVRAGVITRSEVARVVDAMRETATQNKSVLRDGADRVRKLAAATTTGILQNRKRYVNDQLTRAAYTSAVEPSVIKALQKESAVTNSRAGKYKKAYKSVYLAGQGSIPSPTRRFLK